MERFTKRMCAFAVALLAAFLVVPTAFAADYPTLAELYGRYTFNGEMTSMAEEQGQSALEPAARTGYTMVVVPGEEANTVKILGFCGYGGGMTATYDEASGKLHCGQNNFFVCGSSSVTGAGLMVTADAGVTGDYEPLYFDLNFQVSEQDGKIVITSAEDLKVMAMGGMTGAGFEMDYWTYAAGYTLTKENVNLSATDVAGVYAFKGTEVIDTSVGEAFEEFDLTVANKSEGKVGLSGLFGFNDEIEADYLADGGIILLPRDFTFSNGLFMGNKEGTGEEYFGMDAVIRQEAAPWILVEDGKLASPSTFSVNGAFDDAMFVTPAFSFCGGTAAKKDGSGVADAVAAGNLNVTPTEGGIRVDAPEAVTISIYDACAVKVAGAVASSAEFSGLQPGVYIVKAGEYTKKFIVR